MATPTVNFISYNSTGLNAAKITWINDLMTTVNAHFCGVQEHFKKNVPSFVPRTMILDYLKGMNQSREYFEYIIE